MSPKLKVISRIFQNYLPLHGKRLFVKVFGIKNSNIGSQFSIIGRNINQKGYPTVLFGTVHGFSDSTLALEGVLASRLILKGATCKFLSCSEYLPVCMWDSDGWITKKKKFIEFFKRKWRCTICKSNIMGLANSIGADLIKLNKVTHGVELNNNVNIDEHVKSSVLRKLLVGDYSDHKSSEMYRKAFDYSASEYIPVIRSILLGGIDRVIMVHGIYLEHGIILDLCKTMGIPVYIYGFSYRNNTVVIVSGDTYHRTVQKLTKDQWNKELSIQEREKLTAYLGSKYSGGRDMVNYHPNPIISHNEIFDKIDLPSDGLYATFFTNVIWDANIHYSGNVFPTMLESLFYTIDHFKNIEDKKLIVRVHPAESKIEFKTNLTVKDALIARYGSVPSWICFIDSCSDVSSYSLAEISKFSIVYASNIATELAAFGHKVLILGEAVVRGKGFTYDGNSLSKIQEYLSSLFQNVHPSYLIEESIRFAYFWFFKYMSDFDFFDYSVLKTREAYLKYDKLNKIEYSNNVSLFIDAIMKGEDISHERIKSEQ